MKIRAVRTLARLPVLAAAAIFLTAALPRGAPAQEIAAAGALEMPDGPPGPAQLPQPAEPASGERIEFAPTLLEPAPPPEPHAPSLSVYGYSVEGRPLAAYTFGDGPNTTLILASIHGNERNTRPLAENLIAYLTAHPECTAGCTVTVASCVNPDGWARSTRVNAHKVDLNRNFPAGWHANVPGKLSRGAHPLSEPESAALAGLIDRLRPSKIVSIHNPLDMLDYTGARGYALAQVIASRNGYHIPSGGVGYPTPGSLGQYAGQYGIAIVTLELPNESVDAAWQQNLPALLAAIRWMPEAGREGR